MRAAVELHRPAKSGGAAFEESQPQPVAQHDDRFGLTVRSNVGRLDGSADDRRHAEKIERVAGQQHAAEALGREFARHEDGFNRGGHDGGEGWNFGQGAKLVQGVRVPAAAVDRADLRGPDLPGLA